MARHVELAIDPGEPVYIAVTSAAGDVVYRLRVDPDSWSFNVQYNRGGIAVVPSASNAVLIRPEEGL